MRAPTLLAIGVAAGLCLAIAAGVMMRRSDADPTAARLRQLIASGAYAEAVQGSAPLVSRLDVPGAERSSALTSALDLLVESRVRAGQAGELETLEMANRVVRLNEARVGLDHLDLAGSLHNLGAVHFERGEFIKAEALHQRGLSIRTAKLGPEHAAVAESLEYLALTELFLERFDAAQEKIARALVIREAAHGTSEAFLVRPLTLNALAYRRSGDYESAMTRVDRAMSLQTRLAPEHPDLVSIQKLRGELLFLRGDTKGATQAWSSALALGEKRLGPEHPALSVLLRLLALTADALGSRTESRRLLERALEIGNRHLYRCHPETTWLLNDAALSKARDYNFSEARVLYEKALRTIEECGGNANAIATAVYNLAIVVADIGDLSEAEELYERAIQEWSKGLGAEHPYVAHGLDALAGVAAQRSQLRRALDLYRRALAIRRRKLGDGHPLVATTLTNMAQAVSDSGDVTQGLQLIDDAAAIYRKSGAADEPDYLARLLQLRGTLEARTGQLDRARVSLEQALAERERIFGPTHPLRAQTRASLAGVDFARGAVSQALAAALDAETSGRDHLRFTVRYLPERQALTYAAQRPRGLDLALSIVASTAAAEKARVLDGVIQSRGLVLDELAARNKSIDASDPQVAALNVRVTQARQRFANLLVRSLQESVARPLLDEARQQREEAERALAERSADARAEMARAATGFDAVRTALPDGSALVSFVQYARSLPPAKGQSVPQPAPAPSFAAFVLRAGRSDVALVALGGVGEIERLVTKWRTEAAGRTLLAGTSAQADLSYRTTGSRLREAIWDPLAIHLRGASRVFVVPDGALGLVPLASLPIGPSAYLLEQAPPIHYLSAERDLVSTPFASATSARGMLAVGGPAFDVVATRGGGATSAVGATTSAAKAAPTLRAAVPACGSLQNLRFQPLDGTLQEVHELSNVWSSPANAGGETARVLVGQQANETTFKQDAHRYRVLHLATHGFFLGGGCPVSSSGTRGVGGLSAAVGPVDNPLLLSGLALAGANQRASAGPDEDDGILTAEEVTSLNLEGVEWAVLSACDTGVGEIKAGEGVFGLRRVFQVAGARTVIMSLWSVDDQATRAWMRALYEGRFQRKLSTADAVHAASLSLLRERRAKGQSAHPFYWAAFVAAGDWR